MVLHVLLDYMGTIFGRIFLQGTVVFLGHLEQRTSKSLILGQYVNLKPYLTSYTTKMDVKLAINQHLANAQKYQSENGGMKYYPTSYESESEYLSFYTAYSFMLFEQAGFEVDSTVKSKLLSYIQEKVNTSSWKSTWCRRRGDWTLLLPPGLLWA